MKVDFKTEYLEYLYITPLDEIKGKHGFSRDNIMNKRRTANELIPGDIFHPGEFIKDELDARGLHQKDLADKMKVSKSEISLVIHGHRNINAKMAVLLEIALGIDAEFWMTLQIRYDINLIKKKFQKSISMAKISKTRKEKFKKLVGATPTKR